MPSKAYKEYKKNLSDVHRLIKAHDRENAPNPGKRGLGHLTRGGILLLCAAWERYIESVLEESAKELTKSFSNLSEFPIRPQQKTRDHANSGRTPWTSSDLATDRWKEVYLNAVKMRTNKLNTPKYEYLKPLYEDFIEVSDIAFAWSLGKNLIDKFVSHRGEVAHRGSQSPYVRITYLKKSVAMVDKYVLETDNYLSDHLQALHRLNEKPWNRKN